MLIVLDTNIVFQALYSNTGASFKILEDIFNRDIEIAISVPVFLEYESVLKRKENLGKFGLQISDINDILAAIAYLSKKFGIFFDMVPNLKDETDNKFINLCFRSSAEYLVTNNIKDYIRKSDLLFPDIEIITPSQFMKLRRYKNG